MKKSFSNLLGLVAGVILIIWGIINGGGNMVNFIDIPSIVITLFGSAAAMLVVFPIQTLKNTPKTIKLLLIDSKVNKVQVVQTFTEMSRKSRMNGILSLEDEIDSIDNDVFKLGLRMVVDGLDPDNIKDTLELKLETTERRHSQGQEVFLKWGELAPAFGMLGTLIGLVIMLVELDDPSKIGMGMATALLTTFYGSFFANLIFLPIAYNLSIKTDEEMFSGQMIVDGVLELQAGTNTRVLEERLITYLSPKEQEEYRQISGNMQDGAGGYE